MATASGWGIPTGFPDYADLEALLHYSPDSRRRSSGHSMGRTCRHLRRLCACSAMARPAMLDFLGLKPDLMLRSCNWASGWTRSKDQPLYAAIIPIHAARWPVACALPTGLTAERAEFLSRAVSGHRPTVRWRWPAIPGTGGGPHPLGRGDAMAAWQRLRPGAQC